MIHYGTAKTTEKTPHQMMDFALGEAMNIQNTPILQLDVR